MAEEVDNALPINPNLQCNICGEKEFEEREGFYYCLECGTKQEQVRHIEVEQDEAFDKEKLKAKKQKIQVVQTEKPQLTSWECYNYILRGFVEELLSFGAKEELKLMTLQVWAAYLRRLEIAFFNRKQPDLPKLGVKYLQNDAQTIYNHSLEARKRRKRKRGDNSSCTSGGESMSGRDWRKSKRKLDESNYSLTSATSGGSCLTSSTSANSNRAIKLGFNVRARKFYKRKMPLKHLEKHAIDSAGVLKCHKQPKARDINRTDYAMMLMNSKQIYCVLAIALNLIDDDIQLSDFVRFVHEGHIGTTNVLQYFPENVANHGKEMLKKINFYKCPDKYSDKALRDHIGIMCKNIGIHKPKIPDIIKLVRRYIMELCLPTDIADYVERLINLLPPCFGTRAIGVYPGFESRAMAYIIFTLKLLQGLDGSKEYRLSEAAWNLNLKIEQLNRKNHEKQPLLFVWNEWVQFIEMRKVIISQFNSSFCEQYKQSQSTTLLLEQMAKEMRINEEHDNLISDTVENPKVKQRLKNFRSLFERFQENFKNIEKEKMSHQLNMFKPSLTPALSYFKSILIHHDSQTSTNSTTCFKIPEFMRVDHSQRDCNSYLEVKPLISYFKEHNKKLKVHVLPTNKNRSPIGIFHAPRTRQIATRVQTACFDVTEEEWAKNATNEMVCATDDLEFKTNLEHYHDRYYHERQKRDNKKSLYNPHMNYDLTILRNKNYKVGVDTVPERNLSQSNFINRGIGFDLSNGVNDLQSMHSFELFNENDMEPIPTENFIKEPRRDLDKIDLFENISDEGSVLNSDDESITYDSILNEPIDVDALHSSQELSFSQNSTQEWDLLEEFIKEEVVENGNNSTNGIREEKHRNSRKQKRIQKESSPKEKILKMCVSNMDCWLLMGNMLQLTKSQKSQLQDKFPRSFTWLIETCAQTINVDWSAIYEQLLCIEIMFCLGIEDLDNVKNCVYLNSITPVKDIQMIINSYRDIW